MPLEVATLIDDLNPANPLSTDNLSQGDEHLRLIKAVLQAQFPGASAPFDLTAMAAAIALSTARSTPIGSFMDYGGITAPSGWLLCYGQEVLRTTYALLDAVIAEHFGAYTNGAGAAGTTHIRLPDFRGRVGAGQDDMGGTSANRLTAVSGGINGDTFGAVGGAESHVLTEAQLAAHTHTFAGAALAAHGHPVRYHPDEIGVSDGFGGIMLGNEGTPPVNHAAFTGVPTGTIGQQVGGQSAGTPAGTNAATGSGTAHNNVQPTIIVNKIIFAGV